jgi:peptidoglycan/xylan/chitin deacetylase (PgdA/CDA1 family)
MRRKLKFALINLLHYSGALSLWFALRARQRKDICILGLHRVLSDAQYERTCSQSAIILREETYAALTEYLRRHFDVVALSSTWHGGRPGTGRPACAITFDDGWCDNRNALERLRQMRLPATLFVAAGLVDRGEVLWVEKLRGAWRDPLARPRIEQAFTGQFSRDGDDPLEPVIESLKRKPAEQRDAILREVLPTKPALPDVDRMLTWNELKEMAGDGIELGSHTLNHPLLSYEEDGKVEEELSGSRELIRSRLGREVSSFAYPNGDHNTRVRNWVEKTGYSCAVTTRRGWYRCGSDPFTMPRILLHEGNVTGPDGKFSPAALRFAMTGWR